MDKEAIKFLINDMARQWICMSGIANEVSSFLKWLAENNVNIPESFDTKDYKFSQHIAVKFLSLLKGTKEQQEAFLQALELPNDLISKEVHRLVYDTTILEGGISNIGPQKETVI